MGVNSKVMKIPFWVLYVILAVLTSFNWLRVVLFQANFEAFRYTQPWDYYLSKWFADIFQTNQRQYFLFILPIILICLYVVPKLFGKLLSLDKKSNIKGDNHVAILLILLIAPSLLDLPIISGVILILIFSLLSWMDEQKAKQEK